MTDMQRIQLALTSVDIIESEIDSTSSHIYGGNDFIVVLVAAPHEGNDYKWLLRMSPKVSFDRWANSCAVDEEFESADDLRYYLYDCESDIYAKLFEALSEEYAELRDNAEE